MVRNRYHAAHSAIAIRSVCNAWLRMVRGSLQAYDMRRAENRMRELQMRLGGALCVHLGVRSISEYCCVLAWPPPLSNAPVSAAPYRGLPCWIHDALALPAAGSLALHTVVG